ncbi:MAG: hypothetical protein IJ702_08090 [Fretibacterium sp.]|nr:hypothetical protein [Fretibacterium sp.]
MRERKRVVLAVLLSLCLALIGGVLGIRGWLVGLRQECHALVQRRADLSRMLSALAARKSFLQEALKELDEYSPALFEDEVLWAHVRGVLEENGVELLTARPDDPALPPGEEENPRALTLAFRGAYDGVMRGIACWRVLPVRVAALMLRRAEPLPPGWPKGGVEVSAVLEALP